ncbi:hypothetical protein [Cognaticolwellia mytili]|uniref:hypothetical protein n=1 Tax=Cognaticolwellia mytili TaxID=1888913 RepID=UPI000A171B98|nr:hypothetical protein [Cognaticolwellia mytili]
MLYLYLGYILAQTFAVIEKLMTATMSPLALFFSIVAFVIWSAFPMLGYLLAKVFKAKGNLNNKTLLASGFALGFVENILFHFDILPYGWEGAGTFIVATLAFCLAFVCLTKPVQLVR